MERKDTAAAATPAPAAAARWRCCRRRSLPALPPLLLLLLLLLLIADNNAAEPQPQRRLVPRQCQPTPTGRPRQRLQLQAELPQALTLPLVHATTAQASSRREDSRLRSEATVPSLPNASRSVPSGVQLAGCCLETPEPLPLATRWG